MSWLRLVVRLRVFPDSSSVAVTLYRSLKPDDKAVPENITLTSSVLEDGSLSYLIDAYIRKPDDLFTFANVVDDILRHVNLIISVLGNLKRHA